MLARRPPTSHPSASRLHYAAWRTALLLLSGLSVASVMPAVTMAQDAPIARRSARDPYAAYIADGAQRFRLPAAWIRAILRQESAGDPRATSPKGAIGLMQIMPDTWAGLRQRYHLRGDPYDPHDNIIAGAAYIRELLDRYGTPGWIAAYNAGPARYEASLNGRALPLETRAYVAIVSSTIGAGDTAASTVLAAADPLTWTSASLFVTQRDRRAAADSVTAGRSSDDTPNATFVRDVSAIEPHSGGLFVPRSSERNAQ